MKDNEHTPAAPTDARAAIRGVLRIYDVRDPDRVAEAIVRRLALANPAPAAPGSDTGRCPKCGHARHRQPCLNMASDNDCDCPGSDTEDREGQP